MIKFYLQLTPNQHSKQISKQYNFQLVNTMNEKCNIGARMVREQPFGEVWEVGPEPGEEGGQ